jgi:hypothetical protein
MVLQLSSDEITLLRNAIAPRTIQLDEWISNNDKFIEACQSDTGRAVLRPDTEARARRMGDDLKNELSALRELDIKLGMAFFAEAI